MRLLDVSLASLLIQNGVNAHSHVSNLVVNSGLYKGYEPPAAKTEVLGAWSTDVYQDGWIGFSSYELEDIVCHINGSDAKGYVPVPAGDRIGIQWMGWPESHHGPVMTYLARCGKDAASCGKIGKMDLEFFTIGAAGLLDPTRNATEFATARGIWATDVLIATNNSWMVEIPQNIQPGFYVMRHELIALHYATKPGLEPQHYPQCWNLHITGNGTQRPHGVPGTKLYDLDQPGLTYDIYRQKLPPYPIPGPSLIDGAVGMVKQRAPAVHRVASAIPAEDTAPTPTPTPTPTGGA